MPAPRDFNGKVVAITGAAGGMGAAFARRFARAGARLALLDLADERLAPLAAELTAGGTEVITTRCDVSDATDCRRAIDRVGERFGGIDVLINNAGITHRSLFGETDLSVFNRVMGVNLFGSLYCTHAALATLKTRRGLIIVVSSIAGIAPLYERTGYAASKHALHGLFESLRAELAGDGVDVLIVCPGFTATGISTAALGADGRPARHSQSTVGRLATPESVAEATFRAAERRRKLLVLTAVGRTTALLRRLAPGLYERLMLRSIRQ